MSTPIRRQYLDIKRRYPHAIVFFRLGDFYETFDEDAKLCARELEITLTSKPMGKNLRVPLAGIPHHALDSYLARLIGKGYKVAICEQMEDPKKAKGLVERQVVRVVTPGTVVEGSLLDERANNYLVAFAPATGMEGRQGRAGRRRGEEPAGDAGIAYVDITTGEFAVTQLPSSEVTAELARLRPAELLLPEGADAPESWPAGRSEGAGAPPTFLDAYWFDPEEARRLLLEQFQVASLEAFGCDAWPQAVAAAGAVLRYLQENQRSALSLIAALSTYNPTSFMVLDTQTRRNLEIFAGGREGGKEHSLLSVLDETKTALGARLLRRWLGQPLLDITSIRRRQALVTFFLESAVRRGRVAEVLTRVPDLERLCSRVAGAIAAPRELVALRRGLEVAPPLREAIGGEGSAEAEEPLQQLLSRLQPCDDAVSLIADAIEDDPGATLEQGDVVRRGFSEELDRLRSLTSDVRRYLADLEAQEKERTGIKSLKVGYNKVFGYYIEVSKANLRLVPDDYQRRQTLVGAERFITTQLKEYESQILNARERMAELESAMFRQVCAQVGAAADRILALAAAIAEVDVFVALAEVAARHGYVRPDVTTGDEVVIRDGRHPVVERALSAATAAPGAAAGFVPNDAHLSNGDSQIIVLTGPNMAGKSTYLRQVALIVLLAQMGSYVPAAAASIGVVDRIFTRVGAQEDIASGQSTFLVEMLETANILHNATPRSLIILDEIGRGTSTYDGLAIARAVVEYLHTRPERAAKTLFATHYHELVELASVLPRVKNYNVAVSEEGGRVVFLRKIVPGGSDRSYGVHVAELAGLPKAVIQRAWDVLAALEATHDGRSAPSEAKRRRLPAQQLPLFAPGSPVLEELAALDVDSLTPLQAITKLYELRERAKNPPPG